MTQATISLFRRMMREARHFNDYNFRAYAIRRVRTGFEKNRNLEGYVSTRFCFFVFSLSCARLFVSHHFCSSPLVLIGHTIEAWCKNRNGTFLFTESERRRKDLFFADHHSSRDDNTKCIAGLGWFVSLPANYRYFDRIKLFAEGSINLPNSARY